MRVNMTCILAVTACLLVLSVAEAAIDNNINNSNNNNNNQQQTQFGAFSATAFNSAATTASRKSDTDRKRVPPQHVGESQEPKTLDRFDHRYPDGSYEFRYELSDGTARYERGYFLLFDKLKTLVVVGYYAYRSPDGRYITVFYNADQNGYRQNLSITPQVYPNLPRSIEVPQFSSDAPQSTAAVTTERPKPAITTTRRGGRF